jgi:hypothetical protein
LSNRKVCSGARPTFMRGSEQPMRRKTKPGFSVGIRRIGLPRRKKRRRNKCCQDSDRFFVSGGAGCGDLTDIS